METFISSPSRLNHKLQYHSTMSSQRNPYLYTQVYNTVNAACLDTETRLKELSYLTSPKRSHSNYPLRSNLSTFRYHQPYPTSNQSDNYMMTQSLNEKDNIINQFRNVSELAMDRIQKLDQLNTSLLQKMNGHLKDHIKIERDIDRNDRNEINKESNPNDGILSSLSKSVERLEMEQDACRKQIDSLHHSNIDRERVRDSGYKMPFSQRNVFERTDYSNTYYTPRTNEADINKTKYELDQKSRDYCLAESNYDSKFNDLKLKISFFEKELEHFKNTHLDSLEDRQDYNTRKYLIN